jgi:hypothetical protein
MISSLKSADGIAALISALSANGKRSGETPQIVPAGNGARNYRNFTKMNPL